MTAAATHRPGCRTGIAVMSSGRTAGAASCPVAAVTWAPLADCAVDLRARDRSLLDAPLREDLLVLAALDQDDERVADRLCEAAALRDRDAVRRGAVGLAADLEGAVRLLDLIRGNRRVGHCDVIAAAREREIDAVLVRERRDSDGGLAGLLALRRLRRRIALLRRPLLDRDLVPAQVGERVDRGTARRLHVEGGAGGEVRDEVDDLLPRFRVGERRHAEVVLARLEARDDAVEGRVHDLDLDP